MLETDMRKFIFTIILLFAVPVFAFQSGGGGMVTSSTADISAINQSLESGDATEDMVFSGTAELTGGTPCPVNEDDDVISWSAKCAMKGAYSASVAMTNRLGIIPARGRQR